MNMSKKMNLYSKLLKSVNSVKIIILLLGILFSLSGCERISAPMLPEPSTPEVESLTVMTYNVYVGADMLSLLGITDLLEVPSAVADVYEKTIAADFPARAAGIASIIKAHQPHIIGLQEISLIRTQRPGDRLTGGEPAEELVLDFLAVVMDALQAEGLNYRVAAKVENFDIEMPMSADGSLAEYDDVRLTDYDVILARDDVGVSRPTQMSYTAMFAVEELFVSVLRGYVAVDATIGGVTYRVVNTHLEAFEESGTMATVRVAQTKELVASLQDETLPIILLGDFNTEAPDGVAYQILLEAGYRDVWQLDSEGTGHTCCQPGELKNEESALSVRIDQIFIRNLTLSASMPIVTRTIGDSAADKIASALWPSDHAGVVAHLPIGP